MNQIQKNKIEIKPSFTGRITRSLKFFFSSSDLTTEKWLQLEAKKIKPQSAFHSWRK